jgi:threonine/homoserine/homoserine lactone efflux protein
MFTASLIGFILGFVTSIPIAGPISILVFGRGLQDRGHTAVYLAVGSAIAESIYAYLAFWGFAALLSKYPWINPVSCALAAVILTALGIRFAAVKHDHSPEQPEAEQGSQGRKRSFFLGMTITALNPTLAATWPALVAMVHSFHIVTFEIGHALPFSIGVALGISTWFTLLLALIARFKGRFRPATLDVVIRIMGIALTGLGIWFAVRFIQLMRAG